MAGLSPYLKRHWFVGGMAVAVLVAYYYPLAGKTLYPKASYLAFAGIFLTGLNINVWQVRPSRNLWKGTVLSNCITFIVAPILYYSLSGHLNIAIEGGLLGLAILSTLPTTIVSQVVLCGVA
ncbi:MAG: bile acid:sodium symporter, partial [Spirochaetota bacterium]|nr:bile acid:sodium symporter [Spirochaetota bacterium]